MPLLGLVKGGTDYFRVYRTLHISNFFRPFIYQEHDFMDIFIIGSNAVCNVLEKHGLSRPRRGHNQAALTFAYRSQEVHDPGRVII